MRAPRSRPTPSTRHRPYALTGTLGVQRLLGKDYTLEARYVYTKGVHLWNQTRMNIVSRVTPTEVPPHVPGHAVRRAALPR